MKTTAVILLIAFCILGLYDLWAFIDGGIGSTISRTMLELGFRYPAIIFVCGFICGHVFGRMKIVCDNCGGKLNE
jgi:hypothetical protein